MKVAELYCLQEKLQIQLFEFKIKFKKINFNFLNNNILSFSKKLTKEVDICERRIQYLEEVTQIVPLNYMR